MPDFESIETHYKKIGKYHISPLICINLLFIGENTFIQENAYEICESEEVKTMILKSINQLATENKFNGLERPKKIHLCA